MNFRSEVYNILRSKNITITGLETNKSIFAVATLGLLIGKEELLKLTIDFSKHSRSELESVILSLLDDETERGIAETVLNFIPKIIDEKILVYIVEIVLKFDLKHIILDLGVFDCSKSSIEHHLTGFAISSIQWINFLVGEIFKIHGGKSLLNNDCGTGDFLISMLNKGYVESAIGIAHSELDFSIAQIRKYFFDGNLKIENETNFFSPALKENEKVDMIYCTYPLIYNYKKEAAIPMMDSWDFHFEFNKRYSANLLWMINALQSIKDDGMVVAFVANGTLFNGIDEDIRKYLVANNYIDTVISLPNGIMSFYSSVASSLVILKKNRGNKNTIRMIDASELVRRRHMFFSNEDMEQIVELYVSNENTEKSIDVPIDEILMNGAYLGINRYCTHTIDNAVELDTVTDVIFRGYQLNAKELDKLTPDEGEETEYRIINISDIMPEGFVSKDLKPIKADDKKKYDKFLVEDGDIIITAKNTTIKSAIYRSNGDYKAILSGNLIAIRVNQKKINPYYLKAFIDSEKGEMAIKSIQTGTSIITINANGLKSMKVSLLSKEEQEAIGNEYKNNLDLLIDLSEKYKMAAKYSSRIFDSVKKK